MNKNAIQKYAIWARNELIEQVKQRAFQYGITGKGYGEENASVIAGRVLSADEKRQRQEFVTQIKNSGFGRSVEEVAYTWFNRFVALRFMEVNDYLPTHVRVFSDATGAFNPEILKDVLHLDLPGLDKAKVSELLNANKTDDLYRYLLLTQCNAMNALLPEMFERMGAYTEMLLPNNILKPEGVIGRLVSDIIPEDTWKDGVQIIGWLYQYYNTEPKQAVFDGLKKNVKITRENMPAATQLFTPDWIVRYMVENSLGRLWLESQANVAPSRTATLRANWKYYLDEAEQTPEVAEQLRVLRSQSPVKSPEDIRLMDCCMGSGHILVYAFDVLIQIYTSEGYSERDAAKLILEKNIYGLEIDRRAYQLAYFALMMKARQYNRRILTLGVRPQVYEPTGYADGMEYGSLVRVDKLDPMPEESTDNQRTLFDMDYATKLNAWNFRRLLAQKYDVVVTNPPYMSASGMGGKLAEFVKKDYPDSKSDASTAFMEQTLYLCNPRGYMAMINIPVWMFLSSYEKLRQKLLSQNTINNMLHFGRGIFGSDFGSTGFVIGRKHIAGYIGSYRRLFEKQGAVDSVDQKEKWFFEGMGAFTATADNFVKIHGSPVAYWVSEKMLQAFSSAEFSIRDLVISEGKNVTTDNNRFTRCWWEVIHSTIGTLPNRWFPFANGGAYRKWYGNNDTVVDWSDTARFHYKKSPAGRIIREEFWLLNGLTWSKITSNKASFRLLLEKQTYQEVAILVNRANETILPILLGLLNSKVSEVILQVLSPTLNYQLDDISRLPFVTKNKNEIQAQVADNIKLSRTDWDSFETSWDFKLHPLICGERTVAASFGKWEHEAAERFNTLKFNEEELNRIFIDIYGLQDELTPEVEDKDVIVRRADLGREIRSLISYAAGCMFGRYSLDAEGLVFAGGAWDAGKYRTFPADKDNIIPVCDDEYFDDDIVGRFVDFVKTVYGADTLEENLKFIADALIGKGTPREVIRNYFLNDFYKDHLKIYQKRPIYWLFDSGKKNGFKALIYMHRYSRDLLAKLRTDYVHEQQERYRTQLSHIISALNTATGAERARLLKQQEKLTAQAQEIAVFEEKVHHLADQNIEIDLDDGVKHNYEVFSDVLAKI
jgi:hypothetical protein